MALKPQPIAFPATFESGFEQKSDPVKFHLGVYQQTTRKAYQMLQAIFGLYSYDISN